MFSCPVIVFIVFSDVLSWSLTGSWWFVALLVEIGDLSLPGSVLVFELFCSIEEFGVMLCWFFTGAC